MAPIDHLMDEHRVVLQVLRCLEVLTWRCGADQTVDLPAARDTVQFLERFAHERHEAKESSFLYALMEERGIPREGGPLATMFQEHATARRLLADLARLVDSSAGPQSRPSSGSGDPAREFADRALHYLALMRDHIDKEDHCFFHMARQVLTSRDEQELLNAFARADARDHFFPKLVDAVRAADDLARRLGIRRLVLGADAGRRVGIRNRCRDGAATDSSSS